MRYVLLLLLGILTNYVYSQSAITEEQKQLVETLAAGRRWTG
jgi:hypothetical protein